MSWKSIAGNQTVSRANLQNAIDTGVFIARNGVPGTESNREITKANAQDYVYTWDLYPPFLSKTSNQLPVKSNLAVQSNQIYAYNNDFIYVGNNNRNWVYYVLANTGDTWGCVASATDNRCILAGRSYTPGSGGGGAWLSNDYGETFNRLDSVMTTNDAATSAAMNSYGDYMILTRQVGSFGSQRAYIYWSYDSGVSWATGYHDTTDYNFNGAAMSGVGVYATVLGSDGTNYYVWTSNSFGSTFTRTYLCKGTKNLQSGCVGMSKSGQYQLLTPPSPTSPDVGYFYVSNDYGSSWTAINQTPIPLAPNDIFYGCSVSAGGDYMTVAAYSTTLGQSRTYLSSDFGVTWTTISGSDIAQAVDSSGQFQYRNSGRSIDYGNTWSSWLSAKAISVNPTTYTAPYIYGPSTSGNLYKSIDQGNTYSVTSLSGFITKVATSGGSNNGKYVAAIVDNNPGGSPSYSLYKSSNYGASWSTNFSSSGEVMVCCAVSDDGLYWFAVTYNSGPNSSYLYRSSDSGASWQYIGFISGQAQNCAMSNTGQYISMVVNTPSGGFYDAYIANSSDYGVNWTGVAFDSSGRTYNDIAISGHGKFRTFISTDSGNTGCRTFYSSDYGVNWSEIYYNAGHVATSCDMDDSGRVCLVANNSNDNTSSQIYYTTNGWSSYNTNSSLMPFPFAAPMITGVNVSSDATYWALVSNNQAYSYTCTTGDGIFVYQYTGITFNRLSK